MLAYFDIGSTNKDGVRSWNLAALQRFIDVAAAYIQNFKHPHIFRKKGVSKRRHKQTVTTHDPAIRLFLKATET